MSNEPWSFERVQTMIDDGVEESLHLDYKGAGSLAKISQKRDEIVKDVTAFANSDGGIIIYGISEYSDVARKHLPRSIEPINRSDFSREWLEHVISNAAPRISHIRIYPIPIAADDTKCLYVVEIPKGETAHQATDGRYYRRYNFESVIMRDHEVRDVMNRSKVPSIEIEAYLGIRGRGKESSLIFKVTNVGRRIALNYAVVVRMPPVLDGVLVTPDDDVQLLDQDEAGHYFGFSLGHGGGRTPLFPKSALHLKQGIRVDIARLELSDGKLLASRPTIEVKVYADEMDYLHVHFDPKLIRGQWGKPLAITDSQNHPQIP